MPQTAEERREKKKNAEKRRRERIKANPDLHNTVKAKARDRYYRSKARGVIVPAIEMNIKQKRAKQLRDRVKSKMYRERKKQLASRAYQEDLVYCEDNPPIANDPLSSPPREPPIRRSSQRLSKRSNLNLSFITGTSTPISDHFTRSVNTSNRSPIVLPSCSKTTPSSDFASAPLLPKKRHSRAWIDDDSSTTSQSTNADTSTISSIDSSPTASPRSYKHLRDGYTPPKLNQLKKYVFEKKMLHKRVEELKTLNSKYRKQLSRLKRNILETKNIQNLKKAFNCNRLSYNEEEDSENSEQNVNEKSQLFQDVRNFYCRDDNSRMCAGKKECITKHKKKQQKRLLTDTMLNLHQKFLKEFPHQNIVYSHFCRLRPFYVLIPKLKDRETCQCRTDANMDLIIESLHRFDIISERNAGYVLNKLCCNFRNKECLRRQCNTCRNKMLDYKEFDNMKTIYYWSWQKVKTEYVKNGQTKTAFRTVKQKIIASPKDVIKQFEKQINPYMQHVCNMSSQFAYLKKLKQNLTEREAIVHCDFSENYGTKYSNEIQGVHFGGSRTQITLHTVVIYFVSQGKLKSQCFCTLSKSLRHDASAIWEHLMPVMTFIKTNLPSVSKLHFISDSPSAQYRNRKMFYIMSNLAWDFEGLEAVSWNYTESGHGKGAPDGVGGTLKRTADLLVAQGNDIPDMDTLTAHLKRKTKDILIEEVSEGAIFEKDLLIPSSLPEFKGTMNVHQVVWDCRRPSVLAMRKLSCGVDNCAISSIYCHHGNHIGFYHPNPIQDIDKGDKDTRETKHPKILSNIVIKAPHNATKRSSKKTSLESEHIICDKQKSDGVDMGFSFNLKEKSDDVNELNLPPDDSFWVSVSPMGSDYERPSVSNVVLSTLDKTVSNRKKKEQHSLFSDDDSDSDYSIFDLRKY